MMTDRRENTPPQGDVQDAESSGAFSAVPEDLEPLVPVLKKITIHMKAGNGHLERVNTLTRDQTRVLRIIVALLAVGCIAGIWLAVRLEMVLHSLHAASMRVATVGERLAAIEERMRDTMANKQDVNQAVKDAAEDAKAEPKPEIVTDDKDPTKVKLRIPVKPAMPTPSTTASVVDLPLDVSPVEPKK
jgi:hypothetical protein